jgi:hypothetical protein
LIIAQAILVNAPKHITTKSSPYLSALSIKKSTACLSSIGYYVMLSSFKYFS